MTRHSIASMLPTMMRQYSFAAWYSSLVANTLQKDFNVMVLTQTNPHYSARLKIRGQSFWHAIYEKGVAPDIDSVLAFCEGDIESFFVNLDERLAA